MKGDVLSYHLYAQMSRRGARSSLPSLSEGFGYWVMAAHGANPQLSTQLQSPLASVPMESSIVVGFH